MSRKRLLSILAIGLLALTLGRIVPADHIQGAFASGLEIISGNDRSLAEGPVDEPPTIPPGIAEGPTDDIPPTPPGIAQPAPLAEGEIETDGYDLKQGKKV